jgi:formylmethanofuran--tetrahydromethanopterin N-formyltransferase
MEAKGLGTTAIFCPTEAGIEGEERSSDTPDHRPGILLMIGHQKREKVQKWLPIRIRHCILSVPTVAAFDALPEQFASDYLNTEGTPPQLFGDGYEEKIEAFGRSMFRIPLMGGWFYVSDRFGIAEGIAGGNFLILGESTPSALSGAEVAVDAIKDVPYVFTPAVNGIFASGSKPEKSYPWGTTNHRFCACIKEKVKDTLVPEGVKCVFEVVVNGLTLDHVKQAMKAGIKAAIKVEGVKGISAANYGGNLGPHKIYLQELLNEK